jgi:hypothetical protein
MYLKEEEEMGGGQGASSSDRERREEAKKEGKRLTSEKTNKSLPVPSGLNLTTLAASLPLVLAPNLASPVTGSTSKGVLPLTEASKSFENDGVCRGRVGDG